MPVGLIGNVDVMWKNSSNQDKVIFALLWRLLVSERELGGLHNMEEIWRNNVSSPGASRPSHLDLLSHPAGETRSVGCSHPAETVGSWTPSRCQPQSEITTRYEYLRVLRVRTEDHLYLRLPRTKLLDANRILQYVIGSCWQLCCRSATGPRYW